MIAGQDKEELVELRRRIDCVDAVVARLINERARIASGIGRIKAAHDIEIHQPKRETEVLDRVSRIALEGPLDPGHMARIFEQIIRECKRLESISS